MRHELEEQIVHEDKGYPLKMVKRKIVVLCYFKSKLVLSSERDLLIKNIYPMKSYLTCRLFMKIEFFYGVRAWGRSKN